MAVFIIIAKLIISCGLLYGYYHLFLRNRRFHHYNRFYLLAIAVLSLVIPFVNIPVDLFWGGQQHSTLIQTLKVINANGWEEPVTIYANKNPWSNWITIQNGLLFIYIVGALAMLFILVRSLALIKGLTKKYNYEIVEDLKIYNTEEPGTPFSFFKSIFWDKKISFNDKKGQQIFRHELFHVKEKHSADILLMEILCCLFWFNPFYHLIKKEIKAIHEFLADEYAVSANNRYDYAELLVSHAITQRALQLTHPFFHNQIKRRITMITKSNLIRRSGYISRIMALPLLFLLFSAFAIKLTHKTINSSDHHASKNITAVIDAGHGGTFPGANTIGMAEKDINLEISQKIKQLAGEYNVNIVLTRNDDKLVGNAASLREDLLNRVKISDEAKPDLFISIHVNQAIEKNSLASGFEAYISKRKLNDKTRQFASAILGELKNIYTTDETIRQRDEGVIVIDRETYPSILLECGYLNNPKDLAFITDPSGQEKIARKILEGIVKYSNAQTAGATRILPEEPTNDTISAEAFSKINADDIKSLKVDVSGDIVSLLLKNGDSKFAHIKQLRSYYENTGQSLQLKGADIYVDTKDSAVTGVILNDTVPGKIIYTKVEVEPDYPGGPNGWVKYLTQHLKYPDAAVKKKIEGTVLMQFVVNTDGTISDIKAISGPEELRASSIKVIKESGNWISAMQKGKKVKCYKKQPITYKLA